ncbi:PP2C family protein-serine/threonine phosphatase [Kutzneria sp. CA-103260]|uniref:PP2C family protein-serine/threonine phosphatase n=1 Tax=Kutzneria sp. CA-103260 TaxID=2802641 RepID=UPI001BA79A9A|nr:protein phosphatase 2C domain-containing protein [Kutzneria sp. CA-103260]QUQ67626.1 protein phosphatase [Kutzneria sp. CA-103260]
MANAPELRLTAVSRTHAGCLRAYNQDAVHVGEHVIAVADGMGGHAHGEVASSVAVTVLAELDAAVAAGEFGENGENAEVDKSVALDKSAAIGAVVGEVLRRLNELAARDSGMTGMGTTITALLWDGAVLNGVHIGDSRAYRWRAGHIEQLTQDHTLVQSLLDSGRVTEEEAAVHPRRNLLVRAIQTGGPAEGDLFVQRPEPGDRYLLCSDGLTAVLTDETIAGVLAELADPGQAVDRLVDLTLRGGAPDNVSVVLADVAETR